MTVTASLWILEDDPSQAEFYTLALRGVYNLELFSCLQHLREAFERVQHSGSYPVALIADLKVGDGMLTDMLRSATSFLPKDLPFLIASGYGDKETLRTCYAVGAFDYLVKPFQSDELLTKLKRCIQSTKCDIKIDMESLTVSFAGCRSDALSAKEIQIFAVLLNAVDYFATRDDFSRKIWNSVAVVTKVLDVHISNLRKKLGKIGVSIAHVPPDGFRIVGHLFRENIHI